MAMIARMAWLGLLGWGLVRVTAETATMAPERHQSVEPIPLAHFDPRLLSVMTLGFRGLYDDFATIFSLQMLLDARLKQEGDSEAIAATLRQLMRHKPLIESLYMLSCFVLAFDLKDPAQCEPLTRAGVEALPQSWRIPVTQGFVDAHLLHDFKNAAIYYGLAASRPEAPAYLSRLTRRLVDEQKLDPQDLKATLDSVFGSRELARFLEVIENEVQRQP